jgi:amidase
MVSAEPVKANWEVIAEAKRKDLASRIPSEWVISSIPSPKEQRNIVKYINKYLTSAEIAITESTATELVSAMAKGQLTSVQVTTALCHRAAIVHQFVFRFAAVFNVGQLLY